MALTCSTGSISVGSAPSSSTNAFVQMLGNSWDGNTGIEITLQSQWGLSSVTENTQDDDSSSEPSGSWNSTVGPMDADTTYKFRAKAGSAVGTTKSKKTAAILATASTPTSSSVTSTTATIACNYYPNVNESTSSAQLQYKRSVDSTWTNAGTANTTGGYSQVNESEAISGLTPSTNYNVRLVVTRTTQNTDGQSLTSATHTFTTLAGEPTVTTNAASSVSSGAATLNGTLSINSGTGVYVYFKWGPAADHEQFETTKVAKSTDGAFSADISGLSASTQYFFNAYVDFTTPSGSPNSGTEDDFTTSSDPLAEAADEDHMITQYYDALYATATTITFTLRQPATTSSDLYYTGTAPVQADFTMIQDGTAMSPSTADNAPAGPVGTYLYTLQVSAAELTCDVLDIIIHDAAGSAFRDQQIQIRTVQNLSKVVVNATGRTNTSAVTYTGVGSGHGLSCVGGSSGKDISGLLGSMIQAEGDVTAGTGTSCTLTNGYTSTNDYYNGSIILFYAGTGAGQARVITDFASGSPATVTLNKSLTASLDATTDYMILPGPDVWAVSPVTELSALPTKTSNYADMLQFIFQRFVYKRTQTATEFTMYKDDGSTTLASGGVDDNGTIQTHEELT